MTLLKGENKNKFCGLKLIPEHLGEQNSLCLGSASTVYYNVAPAPPLTCSDCPKINIPTSVAHLLQQMNPLTGHDHLKVAAHTAVPTRFMLASKGGVNSP